VAKAKAKSTTSSKKQPEPPIVLVVPTAPDITLTAEAPVRSENMALEVPTASIALAPRPQNLKTQHERLIALMHDLKLAPGKLPREVRKAVSKPYKVKYNDEPSPSAIARAYQAYSGNT
jgi:hypothetical protein